MEPRVRRTITPPRQKWKLRVEEALRELPEAFRTVVILREMEGFCYEEIAEILDVPAGTVKSRLTRGRSALKQILVDQGLTVMRELAHGRRPTTVLRWRRAVHELPSGFRTAFQVQEMFSAYLDGAVNGHEMQAVSTHLEQCDGCKAEFEAWRGVQQMLGGVGQLKAPEDLGLRLRLAISHESARRQGHWWDIITTRWENLLRPALLQASAGFAGSVALVGSLAMLVGVVATPQAVMANDEPLQRRVDLAALSVLGRAFAAGGDARGLHHRHRGRHQCGRPSVQLPHPLRPDGRFDGVAGARSVDGAGL